MSLTVVSPPAMVVPVGVRVGETVHGVRPPGARVVPVGG
jgi:hypothetical protein